MSQTVLFELCHDGVPLSGNVDPGHCKHHAAVFIAAGLGTNALFELSDVPDISDTTTLLEVIRAAGGEISRINGSLSVSFTERDQKLRLGLEQTEGSRNIFALLPGLARRNRIVLGIPHGCKIGPRPFDWYLTTLRQFGFSVEFSDSSIVISARRIGPAQLRFPQPSYMGSIMAVVAASFAPGETIISNCSVEPSVDSLLRLLKESGITVRRRGFREIAIVGDPDFVWPTKLVVPHDREEIVTLALAVLMTRGSATIRGTAPGLDSLFAFFRECGVEFDFTRAGLRVLNCPLDLSGFNLEFGPHPGLHTDWAPLFAVLALTARDRSRLRDAVFADRFQFMQVINKFGADIVWHRKHSDLGVFPLGARRLSGGEGICQDLRGSVGLLLCGLLSERPISVGARQICRGHNGLLEKLSSLGVKMARERILG